jgi:hypothetical protein
MATDPLDEMLDRSAPRQASPDPEDLRAMILSARAETKPPRRGRRRAVLSGALALFLIGGTGVAVASSDWLWSPGLEDSDRIYSYASPTWGHCELRFSALDTHDMFIDAEVNRIVDDWFETTDVEAAAAPLVPGILAELEESRTADPTVESDPRQADLDAWTAHEMAVDELVHAELAENGFSSDALGGTESHSQVHCDGEDWGDGE